MADSGTSRADSTTSPEPPRFTRPWVRGIRFFVARASQSRSDDTPMYAAGPALRVSATTDMSSLAHAVSTERRLRGKTTPVVIEATLSARHALVVCQALAQAQLLAFQSGEAAR